MPGWWWWLQGSGGPALPMQVLLWKENTWLLPLPPSCAANPDIAVKITSYTSSPNSPEAGSPPARGACTRGGPE